jgi:hypothetical protein
MRAIKITLEPQSTKNSKPNEPGHYAFIPSLHVPVTGQGARVDADADNRSSRLVVVEVAVTSEDVPLELFLVGVPKLSGLSVERARAVGVVSIRKDA